MPISLPLDESCRWTHPFESHVDSPRKQNGWLLVHHRPNWLSVRAGTPSVPHRLFRLAIAPKGRPGLSRPPSKVNRQRPRLCWKQSNYTCRSRSASAQRGGRGDVNAVLAGMIIIAAGAGSAAEASSSGAVGAESEAFFRLLDFPFVEASCKLCAISGTRLVNRPPQLFAGAVQTYTSAA